MAVQEIRFECFDCSLIGGWLLHPNFVNQPSKIDYSVTSRAQIKWESHSGTNVISMALGDTPEVGSAPKTETSYQFEFRPAIKAEVMWT